MKTALVLLFLSTLAAQAENPWVSRTSAADNYWTSVTYGNGLFVAVASSGTGNRVMTSPDGIIWTSRATPAELSFTSLTYGNGLYVAVSNTGIANQLMSSPDGITWTMRTSSGINSWESVTYGNGLFVALASNGIMTSPDGITWTSRTPAASRTWTSVTYGNGLFVALDGYNASAMTSTDGITWSAHTSATSNYWTSVCYGNGLFVAVSANGTGNRVMTSPDGITWTSRNSAADNDWYSIIYGNGKFVAVSKTGSGNRVMTSTDGITWTTMASATDNNWKSVTYGNGMFVAVANSGTGNRVMTWTPAPVATAPTVTTQAVTAISQQTATGNGNITALGSANPTAYGVCWNTAGSPTTADSKTDKGAISATGAFTADMTGLTAGTTYKVRAFATNSVNTVYGEEVTFTTTASTQTSEWVSRTSASDNEWQSITYGNGLFVAVASTGTGSRVMTSTNGIDWTERASALDNNWSSVTFGNGLFVAVASDGVGNKVMTSSDGITWTSRTSPGNSWRSVTYGNGLFVAVASSGYNNRVMTSQDGITWTAQITSASEYWGAITYGNGLFVAASSNAVMISPDGITWTTQTAASVNTVFGVTFGNGLFVAVSGSGANSRIMTSSDGINWTTRTAAAENSWRSVTFGNGLFVAISSSGTGNRAMKSTDGITWTTMTSAADNSWMGVTFGNGMFVAVASSGTGNRVMTFTPPPPATAPTVTTQAVTAIAQTTATGNGNITALGSANPTAYGICWNTAGSPTTADSKTDKGAISATGAFTAEMTGLTANTTYKVRAFATNSVNTVYGEEVTFTTLAADPVGTTNILKFNESDGLHSFSPSTLMKFVQFTIPNCSNYDLSELGANIDATSAAGKIKMAIYTNTAKALLYQTPEITVTGGVNEYVSYAIPTGSLALPSGTYQVAVIANAASGNIVMKAASAFVNLGVATNVNTSSTVMTGITYPTFPEAYIINNAQYRAMSLVIKGVDKAPVAPTVTTTAITDITKNSAASGGNITSDGGAVITARGVCWNTTGSPTISDTKTANGSGTGVFTSAIYGAPSTKYYVRAYATNCSNTGYGEEVTYTTLDDVPVPTALSYSPNPVVAIINTTNVNSTPTVTGSVASGVKPLVNKAKASTEESIIPIDSYSITPALPAGVTLNETTGVISGVPTALSALTEYTITATNTAGSITGTFTLTVNPIPVAAPTVTTQAVTAITQTAATGNGNITSLGTSNPTAYGVCWNTAGSPTTADSKTDKGAISATGAFTADMTGLTANTTYKVRAFATNSVNTVYGEEVTFKTLAAPDPVGTANIIKFNESEGINSIDNETMLYILFQVPNSSNYDLTELGVNIDASSQGGKVKMALYDFSTKALLYETAEMPVIGGIDEYVSFEVPTGSLSVIGKGYAVAIIGNPTSGTINIKSAFNYVNTGVAINMSTNTAKKNTGVNYPTFPVTYSNNVIVPKAISVVIKGIEIPNIAPTVTTQAVTAITQTTAIGNGNITALGTSNPTAYGVCWNTTGMPATEDRKVNKGAISATGAFTANITGLTAGTKYYVRAFATNSVNTVYGEEVSFTTSIPAPKALSYSPNPVIAFINTDNINLIPTVTNTVDSYSISPELPVGITLNTTTGVISGIPTALSEMTNYTVTATNVSGSTNAIVGLAVIPLPVLEISAGATIKVIGSGPAVIDPALVISGVPRNDLYPGAIVYFNPGFIASEDQLLYPTELNGVTGTYQPVSGRKISSSTQNIKADYDAVSGVLMLNGIATVEQYEAIFRSIQYQNTNAAAVVATRSVTFQLGPAKGIRSIQLTLSAPLAAAAQAVCGSGTVADLQATAPAGSNIRWYTVATGGTDLASTTALVTGKYYAESWDGTNASTTRTEVTLTINAIPAKPAIAGQSTSNNTLKLCPNDNIVCTNFDNALSYQWKLNGNDIPGETSNQYKVPVGGAGNYSLYVKNAATGCENISETITVQLHTVTIPVVFEKKKSEYISILVVDNTDNLYTAYRWTYADGSPLPAGIVTDRQFLVLPPSNMNATYMVNITDLNACTTNSASKSVVLKTIAAKAAPTMNNGNFMVNMTNAFEGKLTVRIFNQSGVLQRVFTYDAISSQFDYQVNAAGLLPGMYNVEIGLGDYKQIQKIVIK